MKLVLIFVILYFVSFTHTHILVNNSLYYEPFVNQPNFFGIPFRDHFEVLMCRERNHRMNWKEMMRPCENAMAFSTKIYSYLRTNVNTSYITDLDIRATGEYSSFRIVTLDYKNNFKNIGGDTWRVSVRGPSSLEPYVYDNNNGVYETSFLLLEPGLYNITVVLEGSLCSAYVDPPKDWFKKGDFNGHFQELWHYNEKQGWPYLIRERMWMLLKTFTVQVWPGNSDRIKYNLSKLLNWQQICGLPLKCRFLFDGLGRWVNQIWHPYIHDAISNVHREERSRKSRGVLWIYGDCYAFHFFQNIANDSLCTRIFKTCNKTYNWVYPRQHPDAKKDKTIHWLRHYHIDIPWLVNYFRRILDNRQLNNKESAMLLNLGLHFIRSTSFANYRRLIDKYIGVIKTHFTNVIWRTTTSIYRPELKAHKRFQTNQRSLLFNSYSMSAMCEAGIPLIDVYPMTSSYPTKPEDGIHFNISLFQPVRDLLVKYFSHL